MNYWKDYQSRFAGNNDFVLGAVEGIKLYAHWRNGRQEVGTTGTTLEKAILEVYEALLPQK